jgi:hypothetical protein
MEEEGEGEREEEGLENVARELNRTFTEIRNDIEDTTQILSDTVKTLRRKPFRRMLRQRLEERTREIRDRIAGSNRREE